MGKDLAAAWPSCRALFDKANEVLGYDLAKLCFEGPASELTKTVHCQPAIFTVSAACLEAWKKAGRTEPPVVAAGLSLGEWTTLYAAGVISFEDGLRVLAARGRLMQEACDAEPGGMISLIGLPDEKVLEIAQAAGTTPANFNAPGQIVLSGSAAAIAEAERLAKEAGAKRAIRLPVAGAYHSSLMARAAEGLKAVLEGVTFQPPAFPVLSNVTGKPHGDPASIREAMVRQVTSSVQWTESVAAMKAMGVDRYIEFGPGAVLTGLVKRMDEKAELLNVSDVPTLVAAIGKSASAASAGTAPSASVGRLVGKTALVTGGARGIGRAIALRLASEGADVAICDLNAEVMAPVVEEIRASGRKAVAVVCDVSRFEDARRAVEEAVTALGGRLDILVNNAGITKDNLILRMSEADWDAVLDINLKGAFAMLKAASRPMLKAERGTVINIASVVGIMGNAGQANYAASKGGLIALTKAAAKELASRGIRVNAIAPGFIATAMTDKLPEEAKARLRELIPMKRLGQPEDVAAAVAFLASEDAAYMTGQVLPVCGGMVM
jgi:3-oxoacyl-(acyl-carrier-protein) reductase/malonyl CoA-acyl carrier protein transacylase